MVSMAPRTVSGRESERGFTLAGVIVLMTILMIVVTYTVPRAWSTVVQRDRERQTIFIMQRYAKAIDAFQRKNGTLPVSMSQLADARQPRFLRCPKDGCIDPLTGEVDWLVIPQSAAPGTSGGVVAPGQPAATNTAPPGVPMKDYAGGPFVGIRPNKKGDSLVQVNASNRYEQWMYNLSDYQQERAARLAAAVKIWQ